MKTGHSARGCFLDHLRTRPLSSAPESALHRPLLYAKIQDILIRRSVLERPLGLSTVIIRNAMGQLACIPVLKASTGESLREEILRGLPH
jgi:hypothetical protein